MMMMMYNMKSILLFIDGAVHASVWTTGPLLLAALSFPNNNNNNNHGVIKRPTSVEEALVMTGMVKSKIISSTTTTSAAVAAAETEAIRNKIFQRVLPALMTVMLLLFLIGRIIMNTSTNISSNSSNNGGGSFLHRKLQSVPSTKVTTYFVSLLTPLLIVNWGGYGIHSREGLLFVRFVTAMVSGCMMSWGRRQPFYYCADDNLGSGKLHDDHEEEEEEEENNNVIDLEEGRALINSSGNNHNNSSRSSDTNINQQWIDWHWLAGAGCSSLIGGYIFYPLNSLMMALESHTILVPFSLIGIGVLVHRHLLKQLTAVGSSSLSSSLIRVDRSVASGNNGGSSSYHHDISTTSAVKQSSSSMTQRRRQTTSQLQHQRDEKSHPHRQRLYSNCSTESNDEFFDCLDDIELGMSEETNVISNIRDDTNINNNSALGGGQNYDRQVATYSRRKVKYSDGSDAYVPAGESISNIPPGYLSINNNNQVKSQTMYETTQEWRRSEQIHCIHSRPHTWFSKIKEAYPHVIHGFTPDGMPVIYEAPGKMNLKQLFRNGGCNVQDMIFHYCYLMEYLSNIESVMTEVNANEVNNHDWQEALAGYAHAKQMRLQNGDTVHYGFVVVMDIAGATPAALTGDVMSYLKQAGDINSAHYPGSMRRAICCKAPFWLGSMWQVLKGILPASVKADLLSGTQTMNGGLKQYIDEEQIPVEYGGTSPFKLGEHPFEIGLRKLVERQPDEVGDTASSSSYEAPPSMMSYSKSPVTSLQEDNPSRLSNRQKTRQRHQDNNVASSRQIKSNSPTTSSERKHPLSQGWDGLGASYILVVASLLQISSYAIIGSVELAMPLWAISPDGMGYEPRKTGMGCFGTCFIILQALKRMKPYLSSQSIHKNPLRSVRIGILTACLALACVNLLPLTSNPDKSVLGLCCLAALGACIYLGLVLGVMSVGHLRTIAINSLQGCSETLPSGLAFMQSHKSSPTLAFLGRVVGYICFLAIFYSSSSWFLASYCAITACMLASFLL
ncbi:hypothetical protein ACHAWC_005644 [Mediolabrus comicus]